MKLFLASSADKTLQLLRTLSPATGMRVLFIPNAADPYTEEHFWVNWDRNKFIELGYELTEVDLRTTSPEAFAELLNGADILHVCGGSVSYIGWLLKERGVDGMIVDAVRNGSVVYTGTSAGAMIAATELAMLAYDDEEQRIYVEKGFNKKGLGLVPWVILPHAEQEHFVESRKKVVENLLTNPSATISLHDNQAVWVEDESLRILTV